MPRHKHVVEFFGTVASGHGLAIVMELMEGGSLLSALRDETNPLTLQQKRECCLQIAKGLSFLHENNCIHRDLAARNCLVRIF